MTNKELQEILAKYPPDNEVRMWVEGQWSSIRGVESSGISKNFIDLLDVEVD